MEQTAKTSAPASRPQSALDRRCDQYMQDFAKLNPIAAQDWGIGDGAGKLPDYSPAGIAAEQALGQQLLDYVRDSANQVTFDATDRITAAALEDRLDLDRELYEAGEFERTLNNLASPLQEVRDSFDQLPQETSADWSKICDQSALVSRALDGFRESLSYAANRGLVAPTRQIQAAITQALQSADLTDPTSTFSTLRAQGKKVIGDDPVLISSTAAAAAAYRDLARWLQTELLPKAPTEDAVGRERYERFSRLFIGAKVDLDETYEWGLEELAQIDAEQLAITRELYGPGVTVPEALNRLNNDPQLTIVGKKALQEWMQTTADQAIQELAGTEFTIPLLLQKIECMLAPSGNGGIYYTGPSADFSRPGRMWWSVPSDVNHFHKWQERTTVFHEGVPGHHLQIGLAMSSDKQPNNWRKMACWNSGHGEGWALYAEQLMVELGYQTSLPDLMGVLDAQRLRAARVVLDIGVHLNKPKPYGQPGTWDAEYAQQFLADNVAMPESFRNFELERYLGWPGQAPSYKVGQRLWEKLRSDYLSLHGGSLTPQEGRQKFHTEALSLGSLPMDTLRTALLGPAQ